MGYILPITQYSYNEYQKRVVKDKQNPHYIEKPFKTILEVQYEEVGKELNPHEFTIKKPFNSSTTLNMDQRKDIYGMLTGKGVLVNESI